MLMMRARDDAGVDGDGDGRADGDDHGRHHTNRSTRSYKFSIKSLVSILMKCTSPSSTAPSQPSPHLSSLSPQLILMVMVMQFHPF